MADAVTLKFRKIVLEDLATSATTNGETTAEVMGVGSGVPVHAFIAAADDSAAAALGCGLGQIYWSTALSALKARLT